MKELSIEEKAKAYDEALKKARNIVNSINVGLIGKDSFEAVFPELKESEDKKIRRWIIDDIRYNMSNEPLNNSEYKKNAKKAIAWLEKQGQKPDNKVGHLIPQKGVYYVCIKDYYSADGKITNTEGKIYKSPCDGYINDDKGFGLSWINSCTENFFRPVKEEDWIICEQNNVIGKPLQYKEFMNNKLIQKNIKSLEDKGIVPNFRLWDISDAKSGDVLAVEVIEENYQYPFVAIYKERGLDFFNSYCSIGFNGKFHEADTGHLTEKIHPATKEQRDLLFQKMKEARYEWDVEKKKLIQIEKQSEQEFSDIDNKFIRMRETKPKDICEFLDRLTTVEQEFLWEHIAKIRELDKEEQKPKWNEEDKVRLDEAIQMVEANGTWIRSEDAVKLVSDWLKSLKDRIQPQPKQEWSEKDKCMLNNVIDTLKPLSQTTHSGYAINSMIDWLEKQGEQNLVRHFCDCVHVGCHVNDCKRWCHSYQKEISYTDCNSNCNRYSKLVNHAFNIGEIITDGISTFKIAGIKDNYYIADDGEKVEIYMAHRYYTIIQNMEVQKPVEWTAKDEKTIVKIRDFFIRVFGDKPDFTEDKRYEEFIEFIDTLGSRVMSNLHGYIEQ